MTTRDKFEKLIELLNDGKKYSVRVSVSNGILRVQLFLGMDVMYDEILENNDDYYIVYNTSKGKPSITVSDHQTYKARIEFDKVQLDFFSYGFGS